MVVGKPDALTFPRVRRVHVVLAHPLVLHALQSQRIGIFDELVVRTEPSDIGLESCGILCPLAIDLKIQEPLFLHYILDNGSALIVRTGVECN